jgi:flagellum-specific peptidoglycan hydrolase FlgJ
MNYNKFSVDKHGLLTDLNQAYNDGTTSAKRKNNYLEFVELEDQSYKYEVEKNYLAPKELKKNQKSPMMAILSALCYALQWPQLKRQLSKEGLEDMSKRHSQKLMILLLGAWLLFKFEATPTPQSAGLNYYPSSSEAIMLPFPEHNAVRSISSETKLKFIERFGRLASSEMNKFDIPASIILAQAIVASNYGTNELAQSKNNFFQTTCSENLLNDGIVGNYVFNNNCYIECENAWTSFRANSLKLSSHEYANIKEYAHLNYKLWLDGLNQLSIPYINQLSIVIEEHELYELDLN